MKVPFKDGDAVGRAAREMLATTVTERDFDRLLAEHFLPLPARATARQVKANRQLMDDVRQLAWHAPTQEVGRGTAWGAFNALSEWSEWVRPRTPGSANAAESVLLGQAATVRQRAWDILAPRWAASRHRVVTPRR